MDSQIHSMRKIKLGDSVYTIVFLATLFFQCIIFHYLAFNSILISSFYKNPVAFWAFYLPKISICCLISSFVPLFQKKGWTIVISVLLVVWIFAELIYYRANGIFLDAFSFTMVGNMSGFWNSVFTFATTLDLLLVLPPLFLLTINFIIFHNSESHKSLFSAILLFFCAAVFHISGTIMLDKQLRAWDCVDLEGKTERHYNPFSETGARSFWGFTSVDYAKQTSVIHSFIYDVWSLIKIPIINNQQITLSKTEAETVQAFFSISDDGGGNYVSTPIVNLYIILFESLENWAITPYSTPAIQDFIQSHDNILWAKRVVRQTRGGTSADGQMIVNTGILPISSGASCYRYPTNCYPSLSEIYKKSALIQPGSMAIWNQKRMSDAYHITDNYVVPDSNDSVTFSKLNEIYREYPYVMAISTASHAPFKSCPEKLKMEWNSTMPEQMRDYLDCIHYTDTCLSEFLSRVDTDETLKSSTIIITGDHTIFYDSIRKQFDDYCIASNDSFKVTEAYCPLIIYSPSIKEKTIIEDITYQMDIFPTALYSIGCDSTYYWKGFGINLLDPNANRSISEEEAFILSDKMIRADYWNTVNNEK